MPCATEALRLRQNIGVELGGLPVVCRTDLFWRQSRHTARIGSGDDLPGNFRPAKDRARKKNRRVNPRSAHLFFSQRDHRIHSSCSPRRNDGRGKRYRR